MFSFQPEEFIVEEIMLDGTVLEVGKQIEAPASDSVSTGKFVHFVMEKRLWNTAQALNAVARAIRGGRTRFNAAGAKDRNALTVQLCSVFGGNPKQLLGVRVKDIKINGAWMAGDKVKLGDLLGNRFTITLNETNTTGSFDSVDAGSIEQNAKKNNYLFPNLFGPQRFGSLRRNSHLVGKLLLQEKWQEAAINFLTYVDEDMERSEEAKAARKQLASELDFQKALAYYPDHLKFERTLLGHLAGKPTDFVGALRKLPRHTLLLFLHAYQSHLFNELLELKVKNGTLFNVPVGSWYCEAEPSFGFPIDEKPLKAETDLTELAKAGKVFPLATLIGMDSELNEEEKVLLEREGITQADFNIKGMPELTSKGTFRPATAPIAGFKVLESTPATKVQFALPSGSYATVALLALLGR